MKSKIELIKANKTVKQTDDGVVEFFDYPKAMEEYAEQEKIAFAIETIEELIIEAGLMSTSSQKQKKIESKLTELKSLQDETP